MSPLLGDLVICRAGDMLLLRRVTAAAVRLSFNDLALYRREDVAQAAAEELRLPGCTVWRQTGDLAFVQVRVRAR